jgi:DNA-binding Xre family transcriptional regulator
VLLSKKIPGRGHIQQQKGLIVVRLQIKDIAQRQNMNRSQLQMKAGVTMPLLNRYWNNKTKSVNLQALGKIARTLSVSVRDLFADNEEEL